MSRQRSLDKNNVSAACCQQACLSLLAVTVSDFAISVSLNWSLHEKPSARAAKQSHLRDCGHIPIKSDILFMLKMVELPLAKSKFGHLSAVLNWSCRFKLPVQHNPPVCVFCVNRSPGWSCLLMKLKRQKGTFPKPCVFIFILARPIWFVTAELELKAFYWRR